MPGEGERGEGRENQEKDHLVKYAEELEKKYGESKGGAEVNQDAADSVASTQRAAESPAVEGEVEKDQFESYARKLREKYAEEDGGTDSPQAGQDSAGVNDKITSQEQWASMGLNEQAPENQKQESANLNPEQDSDFASGDAPSKPADMGSNKPEPVEEPKASMEHSAAPIDSRAQKDSQQDRSHPDESEATTSRPGETDPGKQQDSARTNEHVLNSGTEKPADSDSKQSNDLTAGKATYDSAESSGYQKNPIYEAKDSDAQKNSASPDRQKDSPPDKPSSEKVRPNHFGAGESNSDTRPKTAPTTDNRPTEGQPIEGQKALGNSSQKAEHRLTATREPHSEVGPRPIESRVHPHQQREGSDLNRRRTEPKSEETKDVLFHVYESKRGESNYLRIPREYLAAYGKEDILQARVVRTSAPDNEFHIYTSSGFADPHLNIFHLMPRPREAFDVLSLEKYDYPDFARDFNKLGSKDFRNVKLRYSDGKIMMKVDNNIVELKHLKLFSEGGGVVLEGNLNEKKNGGKIRISREFEQVELHLKDYPTNHPRILYMKADRNKIEIGHRVSQYEPDHRTRWIPSNPIDQRDRIGERIERSRLLKLDSSSMTKKEIRAWLDTEGCLYVPRPGSSSSPRLDCSQKHREPLEAYMKGVEELTGVVPKIRTANKRGQLVATIDDLEGIAKVISAVGPFRAPQRVDQVRRFMKFLTREREGIGRRRVVERARKLLGL